MKSDYSELLRIRPCDIQENVPLAPYTTFRIGGPARLFAEPRSVEELRALHTLVRKLGLNWFYLGHGSNILVADSGFDGVVIRAKGELEKIARDRESIIAGAGARLLELTLYAARCSLSGLEQISGIPGSVGGGLYMNAGAYGGEISDHFEYADVLSDGSQIVRLTKSDIQFGYRSAPELRDKVILTSCFSLVRRESSEILTEMRRVWQLRRAKQPIEHPSAGSIFKRPPGDFAGRLIEAVEGKGFRAGGAVIPAKHAGIFINDCGASANDVATLVRTIRARVFEKFNVMLETEILPVGFTSDPFAI